ncbi:MAG: SH3 domain-containing protein [Planctomycetota bacterium]|nr:SH3 domain-containing protein [Planctomycetota bacterium]
MIQKPTARTWCFALALCITIFHSPLFAQKKPQTSEKGYIQMPVSKNGEWILTAAPSSNRHWGTPETIRMLTLVAREWKKRHPDSTLRIGDISKPDGSTFPPHVTHKNGLNIDIFTKPANVCHISYSEQEKTLELARIFFRFGATQILYNHPDVIAADSRVTKWPRHDDHFHVIVDPNRVPKTDDPIVIPTANRADGSTLTRLDINRRSQFVLSWNVLLVSKRWQRGYRVLFDDLDPTNGDLYDSGKKSSNRTALRIKVPVEDGQTYRWKVEVFGPRKTSAATQWHQLTVDRSKPEKPSKKGKADSASKNSQSTGTVTAATLNIRKGPGTSHAVIGQFRQGDKVRVFKREGSWVQTSFSKGGRRVSGWIHIGYVELD